MRVVELRAENVKRLKAVQISPTSDVVVIAGANAQGKSSVLDAIWLALGGRDASKDIPEPVRQGEKGASVTLDLGDLIVERQWNAGGKTNLIVKAKDGARYGSPQKVLDDLIGKLTFDPLAFTQMARREQLETLMSVIDLPFDPDELATHRADAYARRTEVNRDVKSLQARLDAMPSYPPGTPIEPVDVSSLIAHRAQLVEHELTVRGIREAYDRAVAAREELQREYELKLSEAGDRVEALLVRGRVAAQELQQLTGNYQQDVSDIDKRLAGAQAVNDAVAGQARRTDVERELAAALGARDGLTIDIEQLDQQKVAGVAAAKMPVPGLSFDDEGVTLNGVPFSQASGAEQLKVSVAIAVTANPKIRVLRITDGSLLDSSNMALLADLAARYDFQVWVERVDESGMVGVVIEDGMVKA